MDLFVTDPEWHWWIILYFFVGGIAAGAYFTAALIDLVGNDRERELGRIGYWIAFPLVLLCGLFLTVDLNRPERFWHMLLKSEIVHQALAEGWPGSAASWRTMSHALLWKHWSPMSVGAWALLIFGVCSGLSFLGSLEPAIPAPGSGRHWPGRWLRHGFFGKLLQLVGCAVGFFIASYTGALLTATNQPLWSDSDWIAPLFLSSAASTGIATMLLLTRARPTVTAEDVRRLRNADLWALLFELLLFGIFVASLGPSLWPILRTGHGLVLILGTLFLGLLLPILLHAGLGMPARRRMTLAAVSSLVGGFLLRYGMVMTPPDLLARAPQLRAHYAVDGGPGIGTPGAVFLPGFSPEDGRPPGGGPGADPGNRTAEFEPRSKVFHDQ